MRYAHTDTSGTVLNIVEFDPKDERSGSYLEDLEKRGEDLIPLQDTGEDHGGIAVQPGDKVLDAKAGTFHRPEAVE